MAGLAPAMVEVKREGASNAYGLKADLRLANLINVSPAAVGLASGSAPPAFTDTETAVPLDVDIGALLVVDLLAVSGTIDSTAASTIGNPIPAPVTTATTEVEDLDLSLARILGLLGGPPLLELEAGAVSSTTTITSGPGGRLSQTGATQLARGCN